MNNVFTYGVLSRKNALNTQFVFFCLFFSPFGVSLIRIQQESADIFIFYFPLYLFSVLNAAFLHVHRRWFQRFQEKIRMGMKQMKFQWHVTPTTLYDEISSYTIAL